MRRCLHTTTAFALVGAALMLGAASAIAAPHFASATSSVNGDGALVVGFDERGLGNENVDYTLTADATATYACINRGGKNPAAANKRSVEGDVSGGATVEPKNGRVRASVSAGPISAGDFTCPGGQRLVLADVSYTNVVLTDTSNGVSTSAPDTSRTFLELD